MCTIINQWLNHINTLDIQRAIIIDNGSNRESLSFTKLVIGLILACWRLHAQNT